MRYTLLALALLATGCSIDLTTDSSSPSTTRGELIREWDERLEDCLESNVGDDWCHKNYEDAVGNLIGN